MTEPGTRVWLEGIVRRNDRDLKSYLARRLRSEAEVQDVAQEIYLRLLRIERTELVRSPEALLFRLASNAVYEWHLRARNRLPHSAADLEHLASSDDGPAAEVWRAELARELTAALSRLPPKCRAAIVLHRREQLSYEEVGTALGISIAMVKKYLVRGVALCREHLRERLGSRNDREQPL